MVRGDLSHRADLLDDAGHGGHGGTRAGPVPGRRGVRSLLPRPGFLALVHHNAAVFDACAGPRPSRLGGRRPSRTRHGAPRLARPALARGRHRDGFDSIALHHFARHNVTGGRTTVYAAEPGSPASPPLTERTFTAPLDSLYAADARVLHDVSPLGQGPRQGPGHRDMLMSFTARAGAQRAAFAG
ncbi:2OG-Fe dioxygenase family protein [Streptomyces sp. NPDC003943]